MPRNALKTVSVLVLMFFNWAIAYPAWADAFSDAANKGQSSAESFMPDFNRMGTADSSGNITLYPQDSSSTMNINVGEIFQELDQNPNEESHDSLYGDNNGIFGATETTLEFLRDSPSNTGEAYRVVKSGQSRSHPDMRNDPIWGQTDSVLADVFSGEFADCQQITSINRTSWGAHMPDLQTCDRLRKPDRCEKIRKVDVTQTTVPERKVFSYQGCFDHNIKSFKIYEDNLDSSYYYKDLFPSEVEELYPGFFEGGSNRGNSEDEKMAGSYYFYPLNPDHLPSSGMEAFVRLKSSFQYSVSEASAVVKSQPSNDNGWTVTLDLNDPGRGNGTPPCAKGITDYKRGWVDLDLYVSAIGYEVSEYGDESLIDSTENEEEVIREDSCDYPEGFCDVTWVCDEIDNGKIINGLEITPEFARENLSPLYPGDPMTDVCWKASAEYQCDYNVGHMDCWTDPQGDVHCPYNEGDVLDSCEEFEKNPSCAFIRTECVEGSLSPTGFCYVTTDVYDCGYGVGIPSASREDSYNCPGEIRCMGNDCVEQQSMTSSDFQKAVALLNAADYMGNDMQCNENMTGCTVFGGEPYTCKMALGGWQDCCETPGTVSLGDYISLISGMNKLASAEKIMGMQNPVYGSWTSLKDGGTNVAETMAKPFTTAWESVAGRIGLDAGKEAGEQGLVTAAQSAIGETVQQITNQMAQWVYEKFGAAAVNTFFSGVGGAGGSEIASEALANNGNVAFGGYFGAALTVVGYAYLIYQISNILVQIIWECEEQEFELGVKREQKNCSYKGSYCASKVLGSCVEKRKSYCCFESPLSRIIHEQVLKQVEVNIHPGSAKNPNCEGIPLQKMELVDWDRIDLSEWIAILAITDNLPDVDDQRLNIDDLTGSGSELNFDSNDPNIPSRTNTAERTIERLDSDDWKNAAEDSRQELWGQN
ncbi:conjugal transfer protein TraN [Geoalkalibacter subterraneus]|uniref:Conjugal transfer protein TraN n=1 Tax=Geoalkalibacter subterraneus TaxID=483547 RepID=A0A0B5FL69_9BACT|nr:conjugal transfer protein TraN [Geoalkalibacter subterraneus]AJF08138.1 hypothetical protein GSUB_16655 [Geoalkalibacter subterraneus]